MDAINTYRRARRATRLACARGNDEDFRKLRRTLRPHVAHIRRLATLWPGELDGRLEVLERLAALLAEDRRLTAAAAALPTDLVQQRLRGLRAMARPLARRLFAEPPAAFRRGLQACVPAAISAPLAAAA